jgi:hypothetical protein
MGANMQTFVLKQRNKTPKIETMAHFKSQLWNKEGNRK